MHDCHTKTAHLRWLGHLLQHSTVVMDDCRIHHTHVDRLRDLFAVKGIAIMFLPAYIPDYNPIEKFFGAVKAELKGERRALYQAFDENYHKDEAAAKKLVRACENVPVEHFAACFRDCGFNKIGV